jgi:hypothetical protein
MKAFKMTTPLITLAWIFLLTSMKYTGDPESQKKKYHFYEDPAICSGCHWDKFERWGVSQHSKGFTGDFFQAQFYDVVLPSRSLDEKVAHVEEDCIGCHSPTSFLSADMIPERSPEPDNHWSPLAGSRTRAERGIFCDFCHTLDRFENNPPFNHDYISHATEAIDPKRGDLEFPWSPHHETQTSELYEATPICATCHNELNPYGVWVKATEHEYAESVFSDRGIPCQACHMQPMGGKPAKMGFLRPHNTDHWFGGGFEEFVEGAAGVYFQETLEEAEAGQLLDFSILVKTLATGHKFPTGSVEERDVWLHVSLNTADGEEILHIPVPPNPEDPSDAYFITSNARVAYPSHSTLSDPIERDGLVEGDRLYHSAFLDSEGKVTYAQWLCVEEIENRLEPLEERLERYTITLPDHLEKGEYYLTAKLNYRRMPDPLADYFEIERRPVIEVSKDVRLLTVK